MKTKFYILIIFLIYAAPAFSASFDIVPKTSDPDYKVGDEILFEINLDTNGLSYNTVDGKVLVGNNLEIKQVITGSSIISAWIESPIDTKNNQIDFSGIIAGGFKGNGNLFQIILVPKYSGETNISTSENFVYINDGLGTEEKILFNILLDYEEVCLAVANQVTLDFMKFRTEGFSAFIELWRAKSIMGGVIVRNKDGLVLGSVVDIDDDGFLLILGEVDMVRILNIDEGLKFEFRDAIF